MKLIKISIGVFFLLQAVATFSTFSQTRCPVGAAPGNIACLPDSDRASPPHPIGEWIKTWGALASSPETGASAASVGKLSKEDAESEALATCSGNGAEDCGVDFTCRNQCVAVVSIKGGGAEIQGAATKEKAQKMAMEICKKKISSNSCSLLYSECSESIFRGF